jgi:hypothetical protein
VSQAFRSIVQELGIEAKENLSCSRERSSSEKEIEEREGFCKGSIVTHGIKSFKEQIKPYLDTHQKI